MKNLNGESKFSHVPFPVTPDVVVVSEVVVHALFEYHCISFIPVPWSVEFISTYTFSFVHVPGVYAEPDSLLSFAVTWLRCNAVRCFLDYCFSGKCQW